MSKQEILDYVMKTPYNTNPSILKNMLDDLSADGSGQNNIVIIKNNEELASGFSFNSFSEIYNYCKQNAFENLSVFYITGDGGLLECINPEYDSAKDCYSWLIQSTTAALYIYNNRAETLWE